MKVYFVLELVYVAGTVLSNFLVYCILTVTSMLMLLISNGVVVIFDCHETFIYIKR